MALSAEEQARFLSSLREDPAFRDSVRRELLSDELLSLPERFSAFVDEMHRFVDEMHQFVDEMRRFVAATDERLAAMERETSQLPHLRGMVLEQKIRMNPAYYLRPFGRRLQAVQVEDLLDELGIVDLSEDEELTLSRTDLLIRGSSRVGEPVVLVVEATWRPHTADVERQVARRRILADRGVDAVAVIASVQPAGDVVRPRAEAAGVALIEDLPEAA